MADGELIKSNRRIGRIDRVTISPSITENVIVTDRSDARSVKGRLWYLISRPALAAAPEGDGPTFGHHVALPSSVLFELLPISGTAPTKGSSARTTNWGRRE